MFGPLSAALVLVLAGTGCSAIWARTRIADAQSSIDEAQQAGAEKKAPYEYTSALLYLEKAREEEEIEQELGFDTPRHSLDDLA